MLFRCLRNGKFKTDSKSAAIALKFFLFVGVLVVGLGGFAARTSAASTYVITTGALADSTAGANQRKMVRTSDGVYHVVYHKLNADGYYQIYCADSIDGGQTWTETPLISGPLVSSISHDNRPSIVSDSQDNLYVVWWGKSVDSPTYNQIRFLKYSHAAHTWGSIQTLTSGNYDQSMSSMTVDSADNVYVVWNGKDVASPSYSQVRFIKYSSASGTWSAVNDLTSEGYDQQRPFITADYENNLHLTWYGEDASSPSFTQIRYEKYSSGAWGAIFDVTSGNYTQDFVSLAVDSQDNVHVTWRGTDATSPTVSQIKYVEYNKATATWGTVVTFSNEQYSRGQYNSYIAIDSSDHIRIVWNGRINSPNSNYVLRYVENLGSGWSAPTALTDDVVDNQYANLIWYINPTINHARINRPKAGYAFIWSSGTTIYFYKSDDLAWDAPAAMLTYTAGANGTITGSTPQTVNFGADGTAVTAVPDTGYRFVDWSDSSTNNPRIDTNNTVDKTVTANFVLARGKKIDTVPIVITPSITIGIPNASASYNADAVIGLDWSSVDGAFTKYKVYYSSDNGTVWTAIGETPSTSFSWTIPDVGTTQGKIKVEGYDNAGNLLATSLSNGNFTVIGETVPEPEEGTQPPTTPLAVDPTATGTYSPAEALENNPDINTDLGLSVKNQEPNSNPSCVSGTLIKASFPAVYYCGADGKRYVFVNAPAFFSWYPDFSTVQTITDTQMASIPLGGNITYRPGSRMVKIQTDPKVYVVARGGILRWVSSEAVASRLYGANWATMIDDVPDSFFVNYKVGLPI